MERDRDGEDLTPFWLQRTTSLRLRLRLRLRQRLSSIFFSSGLVVVLLLVAAVFFLVFVVSSTLSFSAQIFRPNNVKKSWDSLNIVLVLAAVVFGFLSRNNNGDRYYEYQTSSIKQNETQKSNPSTPYQWYNYSTDEAQKSNATTANQWYDQYLDNENKVYKSSTMRRTSSSYPNLHDFSSNWTYGDDSRRFYDDIHVDTYHKLHRRGRSLEEIDREREQNTKNIYVDTVTARRPKEVSKTLPLPAMPPGPPAQKQDVEKPKRTYESVGRKKERSKVERNLDPRKPIALTNSPPPPPPPVLQPKSGICDRNKGGAMGLNSLYHKTKKKQRQTCVDNLDSLFHQTQTPELHFQLPKRSPPPPPSVFHNIFLSKKSKGKGPVIVTSPNPAPIPPPQPLPPKAEREPKLSAQIVPLTTQKPPELVEMNSFENADENSNSGGESPLMTMPPPPPFF
ncbi:ras-associated and pleckstrin homology domains-containing protein 1-like [Olea europaea var. sylvestris]|uniref:ras-associated and pleckstrin homology domains-containing protein 1-like n=1 Tax=Olea europaea var. sylvestris TaxID=158386 RepID=UPI000C1D651D|nr:ras-associated and pleckstrin homology domains-containing protein 1-like [Olea europaea var. sylvestris]